MLARLGHDGRLVTPGPLVSSWTAHTLEIGDIQRRVREAGITVDASPGLIPVSAGEARTACAFTGSETNVPADAVLLVTARIPDDGLFLALEQRRAECAGAWRAVGELRGGCLGSDHISGAVWAGRRYAEELDSPGPPSRDRGYRREYTALSGHAWPGG